MRGAETVEEMQEWQARLEGRRLSDQGNVHDLLYAAGGQHRPAGRSGRHDVALIPEDRKGLGRQGAGGNVEDRRRQFPGDLEHVGDHQEQALRRSECRRQRPGRQRSVNGSGGAPLRLHLHDDRNRAP